MVSHKGSQQESTRMIQVVMRSSYLQVVILVASYKSAHEQADYISY